MVKAGSLCPEFWPSRRLCLSPRKDTASNASRSGILTPLARWCSLASMNHFPSP